MDKLIEAAVNSVRDAAKICQQVQAQLVQQDTFIKKDRSPVTVADYASQAIICTTLKNHFPDMAIVGEEDAADLRKSENHELLEKLKSFLPSWAEEDILDGIDFGNGNPADEFWTLDPVDGTKGFLRNEQYAVALSLIRNGEPVLGVLACPNFGENGTVQYALKGNGVSESDLNLNNYRKIQIRSFDDNSPVRFLESVESGHSDHGLQGIIKNTFGDRTKSVRFDSQLKYAVLARGDADVYLRLPNPDQPDYREKIWDHAAGFAIVKEAGGKVTDISGRPLDFSAGKKLMNNQGVVVTNGPLHDNIINLIAQNK